MNTSSFLFHDYLFIPVFAFHLCIVAPEIVFEHLRLISLKKEAE